MKKEQVEDIYPLSPLQQGMLFHSLYAPNSGMYVTQVSCVLEGNIDEVAFESAWQQMVDRHSILRTAFVWEDLDEPVQVVCRHVKAVIVLYDWRDIPTDVQQKQLEAYRSTERTQSFTLSTPPLMRLALFRTSDTIYHFIWNFHSLLLDGWSTALLLKELLNCYQSLYKGQAVHLAPCRPYVDYIQWLQRRNMRQTEKFWRDTLNGFTAPTLIAQRVELESAPTEETRFEKISFPFSSALTLQLQTLAKEHQLTLNTLVQGSLALLVRRYSGRNDVVFGSVVSGRPVDLLQAETIVGLFINTLPVRISIDPGALLLPWLKDIQNHHAESRQYEHSSLVQVQGWSELPRGCPLFDCVLVFENYPVDFSVFAENEACEIHDIGIWEQTHYPLTLMVAPGLPMSLQAIYNSSYFDLPTIERMMEYLQTLLEAFVAHPLQRLGALPLGSKTEASAINDILRRTNQTKVNYPAGVTIHQLFSIHAREVPLASAVVEGEHVLSFGELDKESNRVAQALVNNGVIPEHLVAVMLDRSTLLLKAIMGILKSGAAYVPIDPTYPEQRIRYMLHDSKCSVLITDSTRLDTVARYLPPTIRLIICLDQAASRHEIIPLISGRDVAGFCEENPNVAGSEENTAYVIYTSGSTGEAKGVMITHKAVLNTLHWLQKTFALGPNDVIAQKTSSSFTDSVWEFFWPLIVGARQVIIDHASVKDPRALLTRLRDENVTITQFVPAMMEAFLDAISPVDGEELLPGLKWVFNGGEILPVKTARRWYAHFPHAKIANIYGMTESAIYATNYVVETLSLENQMHVPIGKPIDNTVTYVLGSDDQICPLYMKGEICIGGVGLARGYFNRPDLTAEKFRPDPFSQNGARLYRTGDLGRYLPDGTIECLGRIDHQVKIRGFRVELGEVEAVVAQHPDVMKAVVVVREIISGDKHLVAYIVPEQGCEISNSELRRFTKERLPDYMVPGVFVSIAAFPVTTNGKVDRDALPTPKLDRSVQEQPFIAPRTSTEEFLASIWAEVLHMEQVGVYDNFFELGGHSLLVIQVVSRLRSTLQLEVPLQILFDSPCIADLAAWIDQNQVDGADGAMAAQILGDVEQLSDDEVQDLLHAYENTPDEKGHQGE